MSFDCQKRKKTLKTYVNQVFLVDAGRKLNVHKMYRMLTSF